MINELKNFNKMHPGLRLSLIADDAMTERMSDNATIIFGVWMMYYQDMISCGILNINMDFMQAMII